MVSLKTTQTFPLPQLSAFWPLCLASLLTHLLAGMLWGSHLLRAKATPRLLSLSARPLVPVPLYSSVFIGRCFVDVSASFLLFISLPHTIEIPWTLSVLSVHPSCLSQGCVNNCR